MKWILASILIILLLMQTFSSWFIVLEYELNKSYISKNLCINKAKPRLHCNGKCQMMKRLAEEEKQNNSGSQTTAKIKIQETVFTDETEKSISFSPFQINRTYSEEPPLAKYNAPSLSIFHPPALA